MKLPLITILATALFGQSSKIADDKLKDYWRAVAEHYASVAAFEESLTPQQKQLQDQIDKADKNLSGIRISMCGPDATLNEQGKEPMCYPKSGTTEIKK